MHNELNNEMLVQIGDQIKRLRKEKRMSVRLLAKEANLSYGTVWRMENGQQNFTITTFSTICRILDTYIDIHIFPISQKGS